MKYRLLNKTSVYPAKVYNIEKAFELIFVNCQQIYLIFSSHQQMKIFDTEQNKKV